MTGDGLDRAPHLRVDLLLQRVEAALRALEQLPGSLHQALDALLGHVAHVVEGLTRGVDTVEALLDARLALLDDPAQHRNRQQAAAALLLLLLGDDLAEDESGEIGSGVVVDHAYIFSASNQCRDAVESDVGAVLRVVQLAVAVTLDQANHW